MKKKRRKRWNQKNILEDFVEKLREGVKRYNLFEKGGWEENVDGSLSKVIHAFTVYRIEDIVKLTEIYEMKESNKRRIK